jgi:hypothetical protein
MKHPQVSSLTGLDAEVLKGALAQDLETSRLRDCVQFGMQGCSCKTPEEHRVRIERARILGIVRTKPTQIAE